MKEAIGIDHITLCVKNLAATEFLFTHILGFHVIWSAQDVGSDKSSMDTVVVQRGDAKIALMQGRRVLDGAGTEAGRCHAALVAAGAAVGE